MDKLLDAGKFDEAQAAVERYLPLLTGDADRHEIGGMVVDGFARSLIRQKNWEQAVKVYAGGLKQYPTSKLLKHNVVTAWDAWARAAMRDQDWREAIRIYELALEAVGDNAHLKHNLAVCRSRAR